MPAIAKALIWKKEKEEEKNWCCRKYDRLAPLSVNSCAEADCFTSSRSCSIELGPGTVISGAFAYTMNYFFPYRVLDMVRHGTRDPFRDSCISSLRAKPKLTSKEVWGSRDGVSQNELNT